ncbi:hypothetical protein [Secundilactobacillus kimchicus]|uniref:hypothetical protein n=1 Tax=Secundilactobacillus kimchicus TaxID=528209 RepID=UPI0024A8F755|nr:hypothetical protein [Secundilactobacillus kimchicus]
MSLVDALLGVPATSEAVELDAEDAALLAAALFGVVTVSEASDTAAEDAAEGAAGVAEADVVVAAELF